MTEATKPNPVIFRKEHRESITFTETPSVETCREPRKYGFEYDRRISQWYRKDVQGTATDEQTLIDSIAA